MHIFFLHCIIIIVFVVVLFCSNLLPFHLFLSLKENGEGKRLRSNDEMKTQLASVDN
jgi:hypothetical protein